MKDFKKDFLQDIKTNITDYELYDLISEYYHEDDRTYYLNIIYHDNKVLIDIQYTDTSDTTEYKNFVALTKDKFLDLDIKQFNKYINELIYYAYAD